MLAIVLIAGLLFAVRDKTYSQNEPIKQDFGISTGGFTNFPVNQNYLKEGISAVYVSPYIQVGRHEFSAGIVYPLATQGLFYTESNINPRPGAVAGYKFYVFNEYYRENLYIHYSFQYLRYKGGYDISAGNGQPVEHYTETDIYINNVIGLGYNLYFDMEGRFGLYYTMDYLISQTGYHLASPNTSGTGSWTTQYLWNRMSTHVGFIFKLTSLKKKVKK